MGYVWLVLIIVLAFIEAATVNLTTIWFVLSGLVSLFLSFVVDNVVLQVGVFCLLGIALMLITKPILQKKLKVKPVRTNIDRIIGMQGIITETISPYQSGEVKVDGKRWTAIAPEELKEGTIVKIKKIDGVKLEVTPWEE